MFASSTGKRARRQASYPPPFGPRLSNETCERVVRLEVWLSSLAEFGIDLYEFRAYDADGKLIGDVVHRIN
jgi:hypothetical protein